MVFRNIAIVGAGNLAWQLAPAIENAGFPIKWIYSREKKNAKGLQGRLYNAELWPDMDFSQSDCELVILSVPDQALAAVSAQLKVPDDCLVVHCSGSTALGVLEKHRLSGVFYPLQTFSKGKTIELNAVPIFIEGSVVDVEERLYQLAHALSKKVYHLDSASRMSLHIAAVFASNFTNHMLTVASDLLEEMDLPVDTLDPLIVETINKAIEIGSQAAQTGPARRADHITIAHHREHLAANPEIEKIYQLLSESISEYYRQKG